MDDVLVFARSFNELLERLDTVLSVVDEAGLLLTAKKCVFGNLGFYTWVS